MVKRYLKRIAAIIGILTLCGVSEIVATQPPAVDQRIYLFPGRLNHIVFLPRGYEKTAHPKWPLILFLHGMGDRGDTVLDLENLKNNILQNREGLQIDFPFIMLVPQCPTSSYWHDRLENLNALLDEMVKTYNVDSDRIYLTGLSMGGAGSWELAWRYPQRFTAVVPIAAGYIGDSSSISEKTICKLKDIPIWVFHGAQDTQYSVVQAKERVQALKACGGNVRLTLYPNMAHNAWTATYRNPEVYTWLLQQRHSHSKKGYASRYVGAILLGMAIIGAVYWYFRKLGSKKY